MKKLFTALILAACCILSFNTHAQIKLSMNIAAQPLWGPTGYDHAEYYYLPDIEAYYYVPKKQFIYMNDGRWAFSNSLPAKYSDYNLYNGYKAVLNSPRPYLNFKSDREKYLKYKNWKGRQSTIRYSTDPKYFVVPGHPRHADSGGDERSRPPKSNPGKENKKGKG